MLSRLIALFKRDQSDDTANRPELKAPTLQGKVAPRDQTADPDENHAVVGLRDIIDSGWFNTGTGEICRGVPITERDVVIDVGCGDGGAIKFCANQGANIIYLDINADKVAALETQLQNSPAASVRGIVGTGDSIDLPADSADKIVCTEVLEHVEDPAAVMAEMYRVGKPGAFYLLTVPHEAGESVMKDTAPVQYFQAPNHIRIFSRDSFTALVEDSGLEIVRYEEFGAFWTMFFAIFWATGADFVTPHNAALKNWSKTWASILTHERGPDIKAALEQAIPAKQFILARKP